MLIANAKEATANRWHSHADATANNKMAQADERKQIFDGSRRWLESSELANPARRRSERILRPSTRDLRFTGLDFNAESKFRSLASRG